LVKRKILKIAYLETICANCESVQTRFMELAEYEKRKNELSCGKCHAPIHFQIKRIEGEDVD